MLASTAWTTISPSSRSGPVGETHNDHAVQLAVGDVALVDAARPVTYFANNGEREHLDSNFRARRWRPSWVRPRRICSGGNHCRAPALELIRDMDRGEGSASSPADSYMQLQS